MGRHVVCVQVGVRLQPPSGGKPGKPHRCGVCGGYFETLAKLEKHFKNLHEREQGKRNKNPKYHKRLAKGVEKDVQRLER